MASGSGDWSAVVVMLGGLDIPLRMMPASRDDEQTVKIILD